MFKSCDYCRHRKKRCVGSLDSDRCADCERLDLPCAFSQRSTSLKRQQNSQRVVHRLNASASGQYAGAGGVASATPDGSITSPSESTASHDHLKEGDCQVRLTGRNTTSIKQLFHPTRGRESDREDCQKSTSAKYWSDVHPFWPFASSSMLAAQDVDLQLCIEAAYPLSLNVLETEGVLLSSYTERLVSSLQGGRSSMFTAAGTFILCPFLYLDDALVQKVFDSVEREIISAPQPVLAGALVTNVWRRLAGYGHRPLHLPTQILETYATTLDEATFGHHYLRLSQYAAEFDQCCMAIGRDGVQPDTHLFLAQVEYNCLLWQVCIPPTLLDTRDDLPATPESVVIHCLSSLLLMSFYSYVLERADTLGTLIALQPVPGALLFICALARSTFICPEQLLGRMSLLTSIQAQTARIMLRLWRQTGFENCRAILNMWEDPGGHHPDLKRQVREEIGTGPWNIEEVDGYSVFWTFRDLRTLMAKFILDKQ